jgi:hypothetical protein
MRDPRVPAVKDSLSIAVMAPPRVPGARIIW